MFAVQIAGGETPAARVAATPGLIAFWEFKPTDGKPWASVYDPKAVDRSFPVYLRRIGEATNHPPGEWPHTDERGKLMIANEGPFGSAVRFNKGFIFGEVPRSSFDRSPLDISGKQPFTLVSWVKFSGARHLVAGVWDEGGWERYGGRRQFALFGGLFGSKGVIAHVSATGAASYPQSKVAGAQYARLKAMDGRNFENNQWVCMAMAYDPAKREVSAFLNGVQTPFSYGDPVIQDVFGHKKKEPLNPVAFEWPLFSPRAFTLKYNGYNLPAGGVAEHWIYIDTEQRRVTYGRNAPDPAKVKDKFRVRFDLQREKKSLLPAPLEFDAEAGQGVALPETLKALPGDEVVTSISLSNGAEWTRVGTEIRYVLREGAPFTFGRALGLGSEELDHGSELWLSGVAVFNRPLTAEELKGLSFTDEKR